MTGHVADTPTGYLHHALLRGLDASRTFLTNIQHLDDNFSFAITQLKPTLDGTYIIPHQKHNYPTNITHYIISLEDPNSYAMLATLEGPICTRLHTLINIRGTNHGHIVHI